MEDNKKLKGIIKTDNTFYGDSSNLYGENFLKDKEGNEVIDPITNKPVMNPFEDTHGDRIFGAMADALSEPADQDHVNLTPEQFKLLEKGVPIEDILNSADSSEKIELDFEKQLTEYNNQINVTEAKRRNKFLRDVEKLSDGEKKLNNLIDEFNKSTDPESKRELYNKVLEQMNENHQSYVEKYIGDVKKGDVGDYIASMKNFDENMDNLDAENPKYFKKL